MKTRVYYGNADELSDDHLFSAGYALVSSNRQQKIDTKRFMKDKCLSMGVALLLEKVRLDLGLGDVPVEYNACGKPYFRDVPGVKFNLSHSGSRVMCAVANRDVGCDVEQWGEINPDIPRRFFFDSEYNLVFSQPDEEKQNRMFFRLWTIKESFMKAVGLGFHLPLREFCVNIDENNNVTAIQSVSDEEVWFKEYHPEAGYSYACCCKENDFEEEMRLVAFDSIIRELNNK